MGYYDSELTTRITLDDEDIDVVVTYEVYSENDIELIAITTEDGEEVTDQVDEFQKNLIIERAFEYELEM